MTDAILAPEQIARLPVGPTARRGLGWWGVWCLVITEGALFVYLLFSYYYFAVQFDVNWLPQGHAPSLRLALPDTIVLILSSVALWFGDRGVRRGSRGQNLVGVGVALILGIVFVAVQYLEWSGKTFSPRSHSYGSLYFTITGFHMAHVVAGLGVLLTVFAWSLLGYFNPRRSAPVLIASVYWHFVDVVWIFVFTTFYLTPYLMW
jgi:heme/copper-type cytochrome/quinol oxidase subunit 3